MLEMLKPKDMVERSCHECVRSHRCNPGLYNKTRGTIKRVNPFVDKGFDVEGPYGSTGTATTKCSSGNLKKIEKEPAPYWGISQNKPPQAEQRPEPKVETLEPAIAVPTVGNFGYGPACSLCRATKGEDHAVICQLEGTLRLDE